MKITHPNSAMNTIVLTVHDKQETIGRILHKIFINTSSSTSRLIILADGCTDNSIEEMEKCIERNNSHFEIQIISLDDVWETKANNVGLRLVRTPFATIIQDDMLILEKNWDQKLLNVFKAQKIFAVSGRAAHDFNLNGGVFKPVNLHGREFPFGTESLFGRGIGRVMAKFEPYFVYKFWSPVNLALTVNRGPLIIDAELLKALHYLDESFAPFELDDVDLCCRAYKKFNLRSASHPIYYKELNGSKATNLSSQQISQQAILKNTKLLIERHLDLSVHDFSRKKYQG